MKNLLLLTFCLFSFTIVAQRTSVAVNESIIMNPQSFHRVDSIDLYFSFPCIAFYGEYGIEEDHYKDKIYSTQWSGDSIAKYDMEGNLIDKFIIPGVSQIRDLAYDGEFFYGGSNDTVLYVMDFITRELIIAVDMPTRIQGIAFDKWDQVFWVCEECSSIMYKICYLLNTKFYHGLV